MTLALNAEQPRGLADRLAYSPAEACDVLGVSMTTIRTLMSTGRLRYTTAAGRILIPRKAVEAYLDSPPDRKVNRPGYRVNR